MTSSSPLLPTYVGYISTTWDALLIFEACLSGHLSHIPRRPHDKERADLIKSGYVFVYEEHSSGIKRWTDGVNWSPSRIMNNFLVYRELNRPFPPGEKKKALKRTQRRSPEAGITKKSPSHVHSTHGVALPPTPPAVSTSHYLASTPGGGMGGSNSNGENSAEKEADRALVGSLIDSYDFRDDGRVKKTISITYQGVQHHLVSYYTLEDAKAGGLTMPSKDPQFNHLIPRPELLMAQNFRMSLEEMEYPEGQSMHMAAHYYNTANAAALNGNAGQPMYRPVRHLSSGSMAPMNGTSYGYQDTTRGDRATGGFLAPPLNYTHTQPSFTDQPSAQTTGRYMPDFSQQHPSFGSSYAGQGHSPDYSHASSSGYGTQGTFSSLSSTLGQDYALPAASAPETHGSFSMEEGSYIHGLNDDPNWYRGSIGGGH